MSSYMALAVNRMGVALETQHVMNFNIVLAIHFLKGAITTARQVGALQL